MQSIFSVDYKQKQTKYFKKHLNLDKILSNAKPLNSAKKMDSIELSPEQSYKWQGAIPSQIRDAYLNLTNDKSLCRSSPQRLRNIHKEANLSQ
jgi:hypothetical protein